MTTLLKARVASAMDKAEQYGIRTVHVFDPKLPQGGFTVAYRKCTAHHNDIMVTVAVNTCSSKDRFNKQIGTIGAIDKFLHGETVDLPLLARASPDNLSETISRVFSWMYADIYSPN